MQASKRQMLINLFVKRISLTLLLFALIFSLTTVYTYTRAGGPTRAYAATSSHLNFQARLLNSTGNTVADGFYNVEFNLYTVSTGGTSEWAETRIGGDKVRVANGYLSVSLGEVTAFPGGINWDQDHWLTMNIGGTGSPAWDGEMTPRLKLTAVPYAFQAKQAEKLTKLDGANTGILDFLALTANRTINLPDADGTLCLQGSEDCVDVVTTGTTAPTSSNSGLEISADGLRLLGGCSDAQMLRWDATGQEWACSSGGGTSFTVRTSDGTTTTTVSSALEFGPASSSTDEFVVTAQGGGVTRITLGSTVLTTNNYTSALDPVYVNVAEAPAAGDITGSFQAGLTIAANSVALGTDTTGDFVATLGTLTGLSVTGNSGEGSTPALSVLYGSSANTAVQGDQTLVCASGSGNLTGGGNTITLGAGGTCGAISTNNAVTFSTSVTTPLITNAGQLDFSSTATAGADDIVFTSAGSESLRILENGDFKFERGTNDAFFTVAAPAGAPATYTFSGATGTVLTSANFSGTLDGIYVNEGQSPAAGDVSGSFSGGLLVNSVQNNSVDLGTDTVGDFVATITAGGGLTGTATGEGSTPTLAIGAGNGITVNADDIAVIYGSGANTAVQGSVTIVCPSGTGDLVGTGNTITLGSGGTCNSITISEAPVFDTSVTTPLLTYAGALTLQTTATGGADDIIFQTAGTEKLRLLENGQLVFGTGANSANLYLSANDTLRTDDNLIAGGATNGLFMGDVGWAGLNAYGVAHTSLVAQTSYALLQINTGATFLNAASGQSVFIRTGNSTTTQAVFSASGLTLNGTTSNLVVAGTGGSTFAGNVDIAGTLAVGTADAVTIAANGLITTADDLMVNGGNIGSSGALAVASGGSGALTLTSASGTVVLGSSTMQHSAAGFTFDLANAGASTFSISNSNGSNVANLDVEAAITAGNGNAFQVNIDGDITASMQMLNGSSTTNGTSGLGTSTSLTLNDASSFDVGNYVQVSDANCGGTGINPCYAKITAKATNTLTITPALRWTNAKTVTEYHVPELGGTNLTSTLANRYGRGYFIAGVATGNGTTYYNEDEIWTSLDTFNLLNTNVATLNIGGSATTLNIGNAATTVSILGSLQTAASETITAGGGLIVSSGGAVITGGIDNNSGGLSEVGALTGVSGITFTSGGLDLNSGGITNAGSVAGVSTLGLSGAITGATSTNTINGLIINSGNLSGITGYSQTSGALAFSGGGNLSIDSAAFDVTTGGAVSGVTTLSLSGAITGATATNTINGLIINSGSLSGITGYSQTSGALALSGGGNFSIDSAAFDVTSAGAVSGLTTLSLSGAITGATATNTINGLIINGGALSGITGITFTSGSLNLNNGGITNTGSIAGATTIVNSGTITSGGRINANAGLTVATGQSLTVNGDVFTDLLGNGLQNTGGVLNIDATTSGTVAGTGSNSGLVVAADGISLLRGCANNQILKWSTTGPQWNCAADNTGISDSRVKANVETIDGNFLDKIKDIRLVEFDYICESPAFDTQHCDTDHQFGVIAQELALIFPELVFEDANGYLNVRYDMLGMYNLKAVSRLATMLSHNGDAWLNSVSTGNTLRLTSTGQLQNITGLDIVSGGASIVGGINNNSGGITNAGAITGVTSITGAGAISGITSITGDGAGTIDFTNFDVASTGAVTLTGNLQLSGDAGEGVSGGGLVDCDGGNSRLTWDASTNKFGCNTMTTRSYLDDTADTVVDNNTTSYWDLTAANDNQYPNLTLSDDANEVFGMVSMEVTQTAGSGDVETVATIRRTTNGSVPTCSSPQIGPNIGVFTTTTNAQAGTTVSFVDTPGTTSSPARYIICSDAATNIPGGLGGNAAQVTRLRVTLFEVNNAADLAEIYPTNDFTISAGEVVSLDPEGRVAVDRSGKPYDNTAIGVVATNPALLMGGTDGEASHGVPVSLAGRVPVKVSAHNGPIKKGDLLTSSEIPGVAMKATKAGATIGMSMADYNGEGVGSVMMFIQTGQSGGVVDSTKPSRQLLEDMVAARSDIINSEFKMSQLNADVITAGLELITPKVTAGIIDTDSLVVSDAGLIFKNNEEQTVATIARDGVATLNGLQVSGDINVDGVLEVGTLRVKNVEGLDYQGRIDDLENQLATVEDRLAAVEQNQSQNINLSDLAVGKLTASGDTSLQGLTVNLGLVVKGSMIVEGQATFKEAARFEKNVLLDGEINVLGYANMQGLTVNLDLIVRGAMIIDGKATFKEAARFEKDVVFEKDVAVKGQATFNKDTAGYVTIKQGEATAKVTFTAAKARKPVIALTLGEGKFAQYSYRNVTEEGFEIILLNPATEDLSFSWVAIQTDEVAEAPAP